MSILSRYRRAWRKFWFTVILFNDIGSHENRLQEVFGYCEYADRTIVGSSFTACTFECVVFRRCVFRECTWHGNTLEGVVFDNCVFVDCVCIEQPFVFQKGLRVVNDSAWNHLFAPRS